MDGRGHADRAESLLNDPDCNQLEALKAIGHALLANARMDYVTLEREVEAALGFVPR